MYTQRFTFVVMDFKYGKRVITSQMKCTRRCVSSIHYEPIQNRL